MYLKDAMNEYAFDCRIRKLSPRTLDNYSKQLRYFEEYSRIRKDMLIPSLLDILLTEVL